MKMLSTFSNLNPSLLSCVAELYPSFYAGVDSKGKLSNLSAKQFVFPQFRIYGRFDENNDADDEDDDDDGDDDDDVLCTFLDLGYSLK